MDSKHSQFSPSLNNERFNANNYRLSSLGRLKHYNAIQITLMVVYLIIQFTITLLARHPDIQMHIGSYSITANSMQGVFCVILIIIATLILAIEPNRGIIISSVLLLISTFGSLMMIFRNHTLSSLPGSCMTLGGLLLVIIFHHQIMRQKRHFIDMLTQATTDVLTQLPNRRYALEYLDMMIEQGKPFYLLFLDLDHFKDINDTIGHEAGDNLLKLVAGKFSALKPQGGLVARNGGDEFLIFVPDNAQNNIESFLKNLFDSVGYKICISEEHRQYYYGGVCVGVSHFPTNAQNSADLLKCADIAMYEAKDAPGRNCYRIFNQQLADRQRRDIELESLIRTSLLEDRFTFVYQPQFTTQGKQLRGFEALIRLNGPNGQPISPAEFIPIAEQNGLILDLDYYVLDKTTRQLRDAIISSERQLTLSVNISASHMIGSAFVEDVKRILEINDFPARCLEIEVTEYVYAKSLDTAIQTINELRELGIKVALDDFGTGYASLAYLAKLPIDTLKIDKAFIDDLGTDTTSDDFVDMVISIGHILNCKVISEGVETESQLGFLRRSYCDYIQGFIWSKPVSLTEAIGMTKLLG